MAEKHTVVAFGRMNPPTIGHSALVDKVKQHAQKIGGEAQIHLSKSEDPKKNPLSYKDKVGYAKKAFGSIVKDSSAKNPLEVLKSLHGKTDHVTMVAGSDRVKEYKSLLNKYNGNPDHYSFKSINVISAGSRDPDSEDISGMSASKMREHARSKDHHNFSRGLPNNLKDDSHEIMKKVRSGMKVEESTAKNILSTIYELKTSKKQSYRLKSIVSGNARRMTIGKTFAADPTKKAVPKNPGLKPRNIKAPEASKRNKKIQFNEATGYEKKPRTKAGLTHAYSKGLSHSTQLKRKAHWKKTSKMDPKDPRAYTPAPGDKQAKTKLSKHTLAYRKKFGENVDLHEKEISALRKKSEKSGIPYGILKKVYDRGMAAWRTGHRPGTTPQQWAFARVNSYITKGKTYHTTDKDLREENNDLNESYNSFLVDKPAGYGTFLTARELGILMKGGFEHHPDVQEAISCQKKKKKDDIDE